MTKLLRTALVAAVALLGTSHSAWCQEQPPAPTKRLTVELASGRKFSGEVDARTSDQHLVLRFTRPGATLTRPIEWERIVRASVDGQVVEPDKLREVANGLKSPGPAVRGQKPEVEGQKSEVRGRQGQVPAESPPPSAKVTSITFDARIANWDGDVETDGLLVELWPLSPDANLAPAGGTVEVELLALQRRVFQHAPLSGGATLERVERWTRTVQADDFTTSGVVLRLPFGAVQPEFDEDWMGMGLVHVKFIVPGQGVFEDSRDAVRIRPFAPLRDRQELHTGRRFVPTEGVGRHN